MASRLNSRMGIIGFIVIFVLIISLVWVAVAYNGLVASHVSVEEKWANVENQVQRKADLIPTLISLTANTSQSEMDLLAEVTRLRSDLGNQTDLGGRINVTGQLDNLINVRVVQEEYPVLWVTLNLNLNLMDELAGTENRIAVERTRYNEAVRIYNTKVRSFPDNIIAGSFGFAEEPFYDPIPGGP